jgi:hypothetical protein
VAGFICTLMNKDGLSVVSHCRAMGAGSTSARRSLVAAIVCCLFARQAQALPFGFACISDGSRPPSIDCRLASDGTLAVGVDVLATTGTGSTFFGSIARLPPAFEINAGEPEQILFSLTTHTSELEVIASMRDDTLRAGMGEMVLDTHASYALAGRDPVDPSAALVLIGSGLAGVGAASRRRRGLRRLSEIQAPSTSRKEASSRTVAPSLFAQRSSHSIPLRI